MGKYANVFCDSIYPLQILGKYRCSNLQPKQSDHHFNQLTFKKLDSSDCIRVTSNGHILYGSGEFWTLIAEIDQPSDNQWDIHFDYFGSNVVVQRFDEMIIVGIGVYINPILCSSTGHTLDENG
jgi:hypothetical protein